MKSLLLFSMSALLLFAACKNEEDFGINGTYQRPYTVDGIAYQVQLILTTDGKLNWNPVETIPGHTSSQVDYVLLSGKQFRITGDADCGTDAVYNFVVSETELQLTAETDTCEPRETALSGNWPRVD